MRPRGTVYFLPGFRVPDSAVLEGISPIPSVIHFLRGVRLMIWHCPRVPVRLGAVLGMPGIRCPRRGVRLKDTFVHYVGSVLGVSVQSGQPLQRGHYSFLAMDALAHITTSSRCVMARDFSRESGHQILRWDARS